MPVMVNAGRIANAIAIKSQPIHIAWGSGEAWWNSDKSAKLTLDATGKARLPYAPIAAATVIYNGTTMTAGNDYILAVLTGEIIRQPTGRIPARAQIDISYRTGRPDPDGTEIRLQAELGRREANSVQFVTPDENGTIITVGNKKWAISSKPTRYLAVTVNFNAADEPAAILREVGMFINGKLKPSGATATGYYPVSAVTDPGSLYLLDRTDPVIRSPADGRTYIYVVTF